MQQIMERQKVVDECRTMMVEGMDLIPLELNSYKSDLEIAFYIIALFKYSCMKQD